MTLAEIEAYNAAWLGAWTAKDVDALCRFYAVDCVYKDPNTPAGLTGREALRTHLTGLFESTPAMTYTPDAVWPIPGGFCGRWYCEIGPTAAEGKMRGFDLVLLDGDEITLNEVYVHSLAS